MNTWQEGKAAERHGRCSRLLQGIARLLAPVCWQMKHADNCTFEMVERAPGRWTFTATCSPVERSLAL